MNFLKYRPLYVSTELNGSGKVLREYLDLPADYIIPLSIPHGVDFGQSSSKPFEIDDPEPIYWAYNQDLYRKTVEFKRAILIPHPWLMLKKKYGVPKGKGVLIIGPPPGTSNDKMLLNKIKEDDLQNVTVLIKKRGKFQESIDFFRSNSIKTVTAGWNHADHHKMLYDLISSYEFVVGPYFSSVLILAAALERKCSVFSDYSMNFYDASSYMDCINFNSEIPRKIMKDLSDKNYDEVIMDSNKILGSSLNLDPTFIRNELESIVSKLKSPVYFPPHVSKYTYQIRTNLALITKKRRFTDVNISDIFRLNRPSKIMEININEVDIWLNGVSEKNFSYRLVPYLRKVTEPGFAVDQY